MFSSNAATLGLTATDVSDAVKDQNQPVAAGKRPLRGVLQGG